MKLVHASVLGVVAFAALAAAPACDRPSDKNAAGNRVGTTTVTGADYGSIPNELAVERIALARCAREVACNNVGGDKHFASHDACARDLRARIGADLTPSDCPRGIDPMAVDRCTEAIRSESCNNPVDTITRLATCRAGELCLTAQRPN